MKVLVVGSGGREHALVWAIRTSPRLTELYVAPGNGGTALIARNVPIAADAVDELVAFVEEKDIGLTVVGPEAPLVAGLVDRLQAAGRQAFGPSQAAAQLEGSKVFAKEFMQRHGIPTADFKVFEDAPAARAYVDEVGAPIVIKADGLAAGKGVIVAHNTKEAHKAIDAMLLEDRFGDSGHRVIVEQCLQGEEVSAHSICAVDAAVLFPFSQDHKRAFDNDQGPNTGGMGAYAPVPFVSDSDRDYIFNEVIMRTIDGMSKDGIPFSGVLYAGLMMTSDGPKVLEYNVRFGDPETQVLLPLLASDPLTVLDNAARGELGDVEWHDDRAVATVVMAANGYPGSYDSGDRIDGVDAALAENRVVFHAGSKASAGELVTSGGRVLSVTAWAPDLSAAIAAAYEGVDLVRFEGAFFRKDIGRKAL